MKGLASDNHSGVHPKILESLASINKNHEHSYGLDSLSKELTKVIKTTFGEEYDYFHVFNGTAANVLGLKALVKSYESVFCSSCSHLNVDECGAPEMQLGSKIITLKHDQGIIDLTDLKDKLIRFGDQHYSQPKVLSITQPTEYGTCYSLNDLKKIKDFCKANNLFLHIDGARLTNSAVTLKTSLKQIVSDADAVSFGGTKNGLMGGELVLLKKEHSKNFKFIRKQLMQLPSKTRFLSKQFLTYFNEDLHLKISEHACTLADLLYKKIKKETSLKLTARRESNAVFVILPKEIIKELKKSFFFYVWDSHTSEVRLMTSFDTSENEILEFVKLLKELLKDSN